MALVQLWCFAFGCSRQSWPCKGRMRLGEKAFSSPTGPKAYGRALFCDHARKGRTTRYPKGCAKKECDEDVYHVEQWLAQSFDFKDPHKVLSCARRVGLEQWTAMLAFLAANVTSSHWGQGVTYLVGTLWLHCSFLNNVTSNQPVGTCWVLLQSAHQCGHWALCERTPWFLSWFCLQCTQYMPEPLIKSSFKKCPVMWPQSIQPYTQWFLWEFVVKFNQIVNTLWIH